jgi:hypothetical protein
MGFETIPDTQIQYGLISYDAEGKERIEGGEADERNPTGEDEE